MASSGWSVRVGVVGAGRWGLLVVRDLIGLGARVVVVDPQPAAADAARAAGAVVAPSLDDLAGPDDVGAPHRVEGVVVATPASTHAAVLRRLAPLGVPVFCEKPLTTDPVSAAEVVALLGARLHVMHVWRYHPGVELLGGLARSGELGEVQGVRTTRTNWTSPRTDVDSTWTLVPHDLTIGIEVLGHLPAPRAALAEVHDGRAVGLWAHLGGGREPWLAVEASNRFADKRREVRVHGSRGVAVLEHADATEVVVAEGDGPEPRLRRVPFVPHPPLQRELDAWLDHLTGGPPPKSDGAEGLVVVEAVAALRELAGLSSPGPAAS